MHDLLVDRRAQRRRVAAISLERRLRSARPHQTLGGGIEVLRRHARSDHGAELCQHVGHQGVGGAHPLDL